MSSPLKLRAMRGKKADIGLFIAFRLILPYNDRMPQKLFNPALRILLSTNALIMLAGAMLGPIYALYVEGIGGSLLDASMAGFVFAFSGGLVTLFSGRLSDRVRHSDLILAAGYMMIGAGFFLYQFADTIRAIFAIQMLIGVGQAIYSPPFDKLYSMHLDNGKGGTEWGAWETMAYFTSAIGALAGGAMVTYLGFGAMFLTMSILCFSSGIYLYILSPQRIL